MHHSMLSCFGRALNLAFALVYSIIGDITMCMHSNLLNPRVSAQTGLFLDLLTLVMHRPTSPSLQAFVDLARRRRFFSATFLSTGGASLASLCPWALLLWASTCSSLSLRRASMRTSPLPFRDEHSHSSSSSPQTLKSSVHVSCAIDPIG